MFCYRCKAQMNNTMHFEGGKQYQFNECPKCHEKTKNKRIHFEDVLKEEVKKTKQNYITHKNDTKRKKN